jgi:HEPN domain-containing protein
VHTICQVKTLLEKGNPFFSTLCKEESILYSAGRIQLEDCFIENAEPPNPFVLPQSCRKWIDTARTFLVGAQFFVEKELYSISAFMLHQAVEHTLIGIIQVYTGYRSNTHNIDKLLRYSEIFTTKMKSIFPRNTVEELELFRRLHEAYINSRYKDDYNISVKEAHILLNRVNELHKLGEELARGKTGSVCY